MASWTPWLKTWNTGREFALGRGIRQVDLDIFNIVNASSFGGEQQTTTNFGSIRTSGARAGQISVRLKF
jgi:hypothetical protein